MIMLIGTYVKNFVLISFFSFFFVIFSYNKLSSGASATKTVLSDAGSRTANAARNVGSATAKKLGEIRYYVFHHH